MNWLNELYKRTVKIATMYTGTFIVIMTLNQLLFFGFCLNPVCLIAAMPHVLFITAIVGSWINKENNWGKEEDIGNKTTSKTNHHTTNKEFYKELDDRYKDDSELKTALKLKDDTKSHTKPKIQQVPEPTSHIQLCPRCNSKMVLRTARQGMYAGRQFYGCSQYPKCKGIVNI